MVLAGGPSFKSSRTRWSRYRSLRSCPGLAGCGPGLSVPTPTPARLEWAVTCSTPAARAVASNRNPHRLGGSGTTRSLSVGPAVACSVRIALATVPSAAGRRTRRVKRQDVRFVELGAAGVHGPRRQARLQTPSYFRRVDRYDLHGSCTVLRVRTETSQRPPEAPSCCGRWTVCRTGRPHDGPSPSVGAGGVGLPDGLVARAPGDLQTPGVGRGPALPAALAGAALVAMSASAGWTANDRSGSDFTERYAEVVFDLLPPGAVLFIHDASAHHHDRRENRLTRRPPSRRVGADELGPIARGGLIRQR